MVQVDLAWAYGVGASFAVVAEHHLLADKSRRWLDGLLAWPFLQVAFFGLFILVPLTAELLWQYPDWQLMFVAQEHPGGWAVAGILVMLSALSVVGYLASWTLLRVGWRYAAYLQFILGYFLLFLGLSYGWDGTGYQRLFSIDRASFNNWKWDNVSAWLRSDIVADYNLQMLVLIPYLLYFSSYWIARCAHPQRGQLVVMFDLVLLVFGAVLGSALLACVTLRLLGPAAGLPVVVLALGLLIHPRFGLFAWFHRRIFGPTSDR